MPIRRNGANLNIADGIREFALASGGATAVIDGDRSITYQALDDRSNRVANALLDHGLNTGDRVALIAGNRLEYPEIVCGVAKAGLVTVPVNPRLTTPEMEYIIGHSGTRAAFVEQQLLDTAMPALGANGVDCLGVLDDGYEEVLEAERSGDPKVDVDEWDPFMLSYTSGTTGRPKGVLISHRSRSLTFAMTALDFDLGPGRTTLAIAPLYHGAGFAFAYSACYAGGTLVMMRRWDPEHLLALVAAHRPSSFFLVPAHVQMLRTIDDHVLRKSSFEAVSTIYTNAAPMPQELKVWLLGQLPDLNLYELYGSTEGGVVTCLRPADQLRKVSCVGPPWRWNEVRVCRPDGTIVDAGEPGELWSRSPYVFNGYHEDPEATEHATNADGFVSAGDIAVVDDEGFIYIVDRLKDMIISGGVNVYPREVEEVLYTHPGVSDVAVVGIPDDLWGERVVAVIVRRGEQASADDLVAHCRTSLAGFKVPKEVVFTDVLPRNAAGKILKRELRVSLSGTAKAATPLAAHAEADA